MAIRHYVDFGRRLNKELKGQQLNRDNWEVLRNNTLDINYGFEKTREEYIKNIRKQISYKSRAKIIAREIKRRNIKKVVSVGCGKGILEFYLKKYLPDITVICTEFTPRSIEILKEYSNCDDYVYFDILEGDYSSFSTETCLIFYRVSTEFNFKQWKKIISKIYKSNVSYMVFVPDELITVKDIVKSFSDIVKDFIYHNNKIFCGWKYTRVEMEYLLSNKWRNKISKSIRTKDSMIYIINLTDKSR